MEHLVVVVFTSINCSSVSFSWGLAGTTINIIVNHSQQYKHLFPLFYSITFEVQCCSLSKYVAMSSFCGSNSFKHRNVLGTVMPPTDTTQLYKEGKGSSKKVRKIKIGDVGMAK